MMRSAWSQGAALLEHGFADAAEKERLEQGLVGLVKQQVAVQAAIGRQEMVEDQRQDGLGLVHLAEGVGGAA